MGTEALRQAAISRAAQAERRRISYEATLVPRVFAGRTLINDEPRLTIRAPGQSPLQALVLKPRLPKPLVTGFHPEHETLGGALALAGALVLISILGLAILLNLDQVEAVKQVVLQAL